MLRGFTTNQSSASCRAGICNALHNGSNAFRVNLAAGNVIGHEQWTSTADNDVVNNHADQVLANSVVLIQCLSDGNLCSHTIGAGCQQWAIKIFQKRNIEKAGKSAYSAKNFSTMGGLNTGLHEFDSEVTGCGINTRTCVGRILAHILKSILRKDVPDLSRNSRELLYAPQISGATTAHVWHRRNRLY